MLPSLAASVTVLVLAGGASHRMGRDKALLRIGGERAVDGLVAAYRARGHRVLVASGRRRIPRLAAPQVKDPSGVRGPLAGLAAGLAASPTPWLLLTACDQPPVPEALVRKLWSLRLGQRAVQLASPSGPLPLPGLYHRHCLAPLKRLLAAEAGPRALGRQVEAALLTAPSRRRADPEGLALVNWNTPSALQAARKRHLTRLKPRP